MAKQEGILKITGTIDDITFYKMGEHYYARMKSSLTGKRFWKDKAFARSRNSALEMGKASPIASRLYRTFDTSVKSRSLFCKLTGEVKLLLKAGHTLEEITTWFFSVYHDLDLHITKETNQSIRPTAYQPPLADLSNSINIFSLMQNHRKKLLVKLE